MEKDRELRYQNAADSALWISAASNGRCPRARTRCRFPRHDSEMSRPSSVWHSLSLPYLPWRSGGGRGHRIR